MTAFFTFVIIIEGHFLSLSANFVSLFILDYDSSNRKPRRLFPYFFFSHGPILGSVLGGSGGIRTHASEETGALNQRLSPLDHATP